MIHIKSLGILQDYLAIFQKMKEFTSNRNINSPDELWFLEHNHVFTQGKAGKPEHILNPGNIPIIQTDRGGQVTYHGPGQLIIYPLLDLRRKKMGIKQFVHLLEKTVIDTLKNFGVEAESSENAPGVYVGNTKICSLGLRIHKGCSYHGLAFNINADLKYFSRINPCGYKNLAMSNLSDFIQNIEIKEVQNKILENFIKNFSYKISEEKKTLRKPEWIRSKLNSVDDVIKTRKLLSKSHLATVCDEAMCPNRGECFGRGTATFIIMGKVCTRNCHFCNVTTGRPLPLDITEPQKLADTIKEMQLKYVVITSVCRDELPDDGALHFGECIKAIRESNNNIRIEILAPDFKKNINNALTILANNPPDVFGHNIETVPRLYAAITPNRNYQNSLKLLKEHKKYFAKIPTKSGLMVGLGETEDEIVEVMNDLFASNVSLLTIGQYLQPNKNCIPVDRYVTPEQFDYLANMARKIGFKGVASGPMVRSSYYADVL